MNRETCEVFVKLNRESTNSMLIFTAPSGM